MLEELVGVSTEPDASVCSGNLDPMERQQKSNDMRQRSGQAGKHAMF